MNLHGLMYNEYAVEDRDDDPILTKMYNEQLGFVLYMIAIRMVTHGESFETAAGQVRNETPN